MADCLAELTTIGNATAQSCGQDHSNNDALLMKLILEFTFH